MNLKQLNKQVRTNLRLRPLPIRIGLAGALLPRSDDLWQLESILDQPSRIRLVNIHTHHFVELQPDNVREYRSPDYLLLRCQLIITDGNIDIEPVIGSRGAADHSESVSHRLTGDSLRLLELCIRHENSSAFDYAEADDAIAALGFTPIKYRHAAEELAELDLITIHGNVNHASGIARTSLKPVAFLDAAPQILSDVDLSGELQCLFAVLRKVPEDQYRIRVPQLLQRTAVALPRLDLILRALADLRYIVGHGPGNDDWGSFLDIEVTPRGRRMLRGEDPFPY
jgi:hypothetical protein